MTSKRVLNKSTGKVANLVIVYVRGGGRQFVNFSNVPQSFVYPLTAIQQSLSKIQAPDRPLFHSVSTRGAHLVFDTAVHTKTNSRIAARAGRLSGVLGHLSPHDLRYGAAHDAIDAKEQATDVVTVSVARSVVHLKILDIGVTDKYAGSSSYDHR